MQYSVPLNYLIFSVFNGDNFEQNLEKLYFSLLNCIRCIYFSINHFFSVSFFFTLR